MLPHINDLIKYRCNNVIESFAYSYGVSEIDSDIIFEDMLRFLWLGKYAEVNTVKENVNAIDLPLLVIDEMWHTFILHSVDYMAFCNQYFGGYIHHLPTSPRDKKVRSRKDMDEEEYKRFVEKKRSIYSIVYDLLGREVFIRWYKEYPKKYTPKVLVGNRRI